MLVLMIGLISPEDGSLVPYAANSPLDLPVWDRNRIVRCTEKRILIVINVLWGGEAPIIHPAVLRFLRKTCHLRGDHLVEVVPFEPAHGEGVIAVILPIQQSEFAIPITLDEQPDLRDIPAVYQRGGGNFWVALDGANVVGTIALLDIGNGQAALRKMFVRAEYRSARHGVAARLLEALLARCRECNVSEIYLGTTAQFLAAHRFYEKNDFREIARSELPANFPLIAVDTRFFRRAI